ncbi:MAG: outer membrane protein assembly factor BamA [Deltaproteobacteria bacterium]|nr:outer membrane protein assembly factor BamA [Deltaproteobacteria bacterium]
MGRLALVAPLLLWSPALFAQSSDVPVGGGPPEPAAAEVPAAALPDAPASTSPTPVPEPAPAPAPEPAAQAVTEVVFENKTYFKDETLRTFLQHPIPGPLDRATLDADAERVRARFVDRGFLAATVTVRVEATASPTAVRAVFRIEAGTRAELKSVSVVGNVDVPEAALREGFFSRPPEPLGAVTRAGFFHRPYLDQDAQRLVANYYKRGYLEARVLDTRVEAWPSLDGISVTLQVIEGPVYELAGIKLVGEAPEGADTAALRTRIAVKDGDVCDLVSIQQQADGLLEPLRALGHPFARFEQAVEVATPPSGNPSHRAVRLTLKFVRGPKPTVRQVVVTGNKGTQERVIRRDVEVEAGKPYDHATLKTTERQLLATGFFSAAQARAVPTDDPNVVDVEVTVTEQQTFLFSVAPAFDTSAGGEGLILVGLLADRNLFGTGLFTSAFARLSGKKQTFDLTVTEPRLLDSHATLTGEAHRREISYRGFRTRSEAGVGVRAGMPLGLGFVVGGGLGAEYGGVVLYDEKADGFAGPALVLDGPTGLGLLPAGVFRNVVRASVAFDKRDSLLLPRNGVYADVSGAYAGPFTLSGLGFLDGGASLKLYWTPAFGITLKSNTEVGGVVNPHGGQVPVTDRYFLGGLGSVRGFPALTLSPVAELPTTDGGTVELEVGGVVRAVQNLELEFPLWPATPFRGFLFLDGGNAFSEGELATVLAGGAIDRGATLPLGLFVSTGFGVLIETPVLPFRFEWSVPLTARAGDQPISFFLGIGSAF